MIDDSSRAFFLNELDGFAANTGVLVLATTNHPERLDPAILNRPSRFDRKYYFEPGAPERAAYRVPGTTNCKPALRVSDHAAAIIVEQTSRAVAAAIEERR